MTALIWGLGDRSTFQEQQCLRKESCAGDLSLLRSGSVLGSANPTKAVSSFGNHITAGLLTPSHRHLDITADGKGCYGSLQEPELVSSLFWEQHWIQTVWGIHLFLQLVSLPTSAAWAVLCFSCTDTTWAGCIQTAPDGHCQSWRRNWLRRWHVPGRWTHQDYEGISSILQICHKNSVLNPCLTLWEIHPRCPMHRDAVRNFHLILCFWV